MTIICLRPEVARGLKHPTRSYEKSKNPKVQTSKDARPGGRFTRRVASGCILGLAGGGVCRAADVTTRAVRSYRTFSPLLACRQPRRAALPASAVCFLCHCPSSCPDRALPGALPCGVRTFLPPPPASRSTPRQARSWTCHGAAREASEVGRSSGPLRRTSIIGHQPAD